MAHPTQVLTETDRAAGAAHLDDRATVPAAAGTAYEDAILGIWREVLGRSDIDVSDDFLTLGDHSLAPAVVAQIRARLGVDVPVMDFFESRTVTALARVVAARADAARSASQRRGVTPRPPDAEPVLSFDQQRLWMESQLLPGVIYNVHARRRLVGPVDVPTFERSIRAVLARHEALRSRFPTVDGRPVQVVDDPDDGWRIGFEDVSHAGRGREELARRLMDAESTTPFDLAAGPPFRCLLVKLSDTEHLLGVTMHHIVSDTWSIGLFVRELAALYQAGGDVARADLPPLPVQYRDYAVWQRGRLVGEALDRQVRYWRRHLAGAPPVLALPAAQRRTTSQRAEADRIECSLGREETAALHDMCRTRGVTPFMALLACLATVFGRWSGQSDVVIGVPLAGRTHSGTDHLIGFFVNVLPFRVDLTGDPTFEELFDRVRKVALDGYDHADAPLDVLVEDLQVRRDPRRTPLFEVVLNVVGSPEAEQVPGLAVEPLDSPSLFSRFDLSVTVQEAEGRLRLQLDFASERCDAGLVHVLVRHLRALLCGALEDPSRRILDYPLEPPAPEAATAAAEPPAPHVAADRHAATAAGLPAVVDATGEWGYGWLAAASDAVAALLAARPGDVAIVRRPAAQFVAAILGCRKAGVAFDVVDGVAPGDPLPAATVLDPRPATLVSDDHVDLGALLRDVPNAVGHTTDGPVAPGRDWAAERFGFTSDDRFAVLSSVPGQLTAALSAATAAGAALVVPDCSFSGDPATVTAWLRDNAVSVVYLGPSILRALGAQEPAPDLPALRYAFVDNDGDLVAHDVESLRALAPGCRFVAVYRTGADGRPLATYEVPDAWRVPAAPLRVPLGTELPGNPARLVRGSGVAAATGEVGEIRFGGVPTGDLGRRWPDGSLEFVGRVGSSREFDSLETVATLRDLPDVRDALVVEQVGTDGATTLAGYVAGPDPALGTVAIHNYLRNRLPGYLIPEQVFVLDRLPRTPWGDYDLKQLPRSAPGGNPLDGYVAPRTSMERQLTALLEELLGVDRVGIYDSFFELGGFSLLATQLTTRIRAMYNVELALRDVFESPTVDELAQLIVRTQAELTADDDIEALLREIELGEAGAGAGEEPSAGTAGDAYERAVATLREGAFFAPDKPDETPETTAQALWYAAAGTPRSAAAVTLPLPALTESQERRFDDLLARRVAGEPLAYLTGRTRFMGLEVVAAPGALIPRRETELLGRTALATATALADANDGEVRVLDLCTGAGNLAVSVAVLEPRARVWASDLEADAVEVAERNVAFHAVGDRVTVACGDLFAALDELSPAPGPFDLVVCNPPYLPSEKTRNLPVDAEHEPVAAFDGGDVGLTVMYRLIAEAPRHLVPGGWLCFELGAGMGRVVEKRLASLGAYGEVRTIADADGTTRGILARRLP